MGQRFRYSGTNWEGRRWYASKPVEQLGRAISAAWPKAYPVDGTVASERHDKRSKTSDHRPYPYDEDDGAIVRAIDVGVGSQAEGVILFEQLVGDPRVRYVLFDLPDDPDPDHTTHVHVSMNASADNDEGGWQVLTQHEIGTLKRIVSGLDRVGSNGSFVESCVSDIRAKRDAGGYAPRGHDHGGTGSGSGLQSGDTVELRKV